MNTCKKSFKIVEGKTIPPKAIAANKETVIAPLAPIFKMHFLNLVKFTISKTKHSIEKPIAKSPMLRCLTIVTGVS